MSVVRVRKGNGYLAQLGKYSFWGPTRMDAIGQMLGFIERKNRKSKT